MNYNPLSGGNFPLVHVHRSQTYILLAHRSPEGRSLLGDAMTHISVSLGTQVLFSAESFYLEVAEKEQEPRPADPASRTQASLPC